MSHANALLPESPVQPDTEPVPDDLPEGVYVAGLDLARPGHVWVGDASGQYVSGLLDAGSEEDDLERWQHVARLLTSEAAVMAQLERIAQTPYTARAADVIDAVRQILRQMKEAA